MLLLPSAPYCVCLPCGPWLLLHQVFTWRGRCQRCPRPAGACRGGDGAVAVAVLLPVLRPPAIAIPLLPPAVWLLCVPLR